MPTSLNFTISARFASDLPSPSPSTISHRNLLSHLSLTTNRLPLSPSPVQILKRQPFGACPSQASQYIPLSCSRQAADVRRVVAPWWDAIELGLEAVPLVARPKLKSQPATPATPGRTGESSRATTTDGSGFTPNGPRLDSGISRSAEMPYRGEEGPGSQELEGKMERMKSGRS